jgi:hypothetical protein
MKQIPKRVAQIGRKQRQGTKKRRTAAEMFEAMKRTEPRLRPDLLLAGYYD